VLNQRKVGDVKSTLIALVTAFLAEAVAGCQPGTALLTREHAAPREPTKTLTLDLGDNVTMRLTLISAGTFTMGSSRTEKGFVRGEGPQREVTLTKPFYMATYEVTQAQYGAVVGKNPSVIKRADNPVENVSKEDALVFCSTATQKTGMKVRLPTEAEWEYACKAGSQTRFGFGADEDSLGEYAWYQENSGGKPHPVGQTKPNDWGLYDMHGNIFEWCSDWYALDYYQADQNVDPQGPEEGFRFRQSVLRGGSYCDNAQQCRSAWRGTLAPSLRDGNIGFRVVVDPR
jgi:formylglycine-generating enzyme required for sulfatase activity